MATNRDWSNGSIELPAAADVALQGFVTGDASAAWQILADGSFRAASLGVGNSAAGNTLGSLVKKIEVFDAAGTSLGFVPVYDAITTA